MSVMKSFVCCVWQGGGVSGTIYQHSRTTCTHTNAHIALKTYTACRTHAMGQRSSSFLLLLLVLLVPAAVVSAACVNSDPCVGQPDCTGCDPGAFVPDPENCHGFYVCHNTTTVYPLHFVCEGDEVFDVDIRDCVEPGFCVECSRQCVYECSVGAPSIPSAYACQIYYNCSTEETESCPASTPFFDGIQCQTDENRCCHCHPYCYAADVGSLIADPLDCRKYYGCGATGPTTASGTCPDGENFDAFLGACSATAPCLTAAACTNVVGADGCIEPFTCVAEGYFARCPQQCAEEYYYCQEATGEYQDVDTCDTGTVFNPDTHTCVDPDGCPY